MRTISAEEITSAIQVLVTQIAQRHSETPKVVLAGIANGGIPLNDWLYDELKSKLNGTLSKGIIDISFHRDDLGRKPFTKEVESTQLFHNPEDAIVILVDDVLHSGRTIRAALAELHTIGRPNKVELAILVDRGNRRLPIAPDYVGIVTETLESENIDVHIDTAIHSNSKIEIK